MAMEKPTLPMDIREVFIERYNQSHEHNVVLEALESVEIPESTRRNVRREGDPIPQGVCLGMTECYFKGPMPSAAIRKKPRLTQLLCDFARWEKPGFEFTSIQINKDYAAALHVDKNDAGRSVIIGLGNYVGGQLWVDDGSKLGKCMDLQGTWHNLDGNLAHEVLPFRGRRYTLVYFSRVNGGDVGADPTSLSAQRLLKLGFPLSPTMPVLGNYPPAETRMEKGRVKVERFKTRCAQRGGPFRKRLRLSVPEHNEAPAGVLQVAMETDTPLSWLADAVSAKLGLPLGTRLQLRLGSFSVLPSDTISGLGLGPRDLLEVVLTGDYAPAHFAVKGSFCREGSGPSPSTPPRSASALRSRGLSTSSFADDSSPLGKVAAKMRVPCSGCDEKEPQREDELWYL